MIKCPDRRSRLSCLAAGVLLALASAAPCSVSAQTGTRPEESGGLAGKWEEVFLLEALRYLRLTPSQLRQIQPLVQAAEDRLAPCRKNGSRVWQFRTGDGGLMYKTTDRPNASACPPLLGKGIGCNEPESLGSRLMLSNGCFHPVKTGLTFDENAVPHRPRSWPAPSCPNATRCQAARRLRRP